MTMRKFFPLIALFLLVGCASNGGLNENENPERKRHSPIPSSGSPGGPPTFQDLFNEGTLDSNVWAVSDGTWPGTNYMNPNNVDLSTGMLRIKLVVNAEAGIHAGGEISTLTAFGYGTYEWVIRTSSSSSTPNGSGSSASGSVSAGFNYINNSQTEIDAVEVTGDNPSFNNMTSWTSGNTEETSSVPVPGGCDQGFHTYRMVWTASSVEFFLDGMLVHTNTKVLPAAPAPVLINHWVGNSNWGGTPTDQTSYLYCSRFTFWAL